MNENHWTVFRQGSSLRFTDPQAALAHFARARGMAEEANDRHAVLYINHWTLQVLIFNVRDYAAAYDLAVEAALEARKPIHQEQMERICVHEDLISTYIGIDPVGYAELIEDALDYMEQEISPDLQCKYCLQGARAGFELACQRPDRMREAANRYLAMSEGFHHHYCAAHTSMCQLYYAQQEWENLLQFAQTGEGLMGPDRHYSADVAQLIAAQALAHRKMGHEMAAVTAYRRATAKAASTTSVMESAYYDMLCDYHEAEGSLQAALSLRQRQLTELVGKGQPFWETRCRVQMVRLMKQMDQPIDEEMRAARLTAAKLRKPEAFVKALDDLGVV